MDTITLIVCELASYSVLSWLVFACVVYGAARYGGAGFVPFAHFAVVVVVVFLDLRSIDAEMSKPGWNGIPDRDFLFCIGMAMRIVVINVVLLPVTGIGLWRRQHKHVQDCPALAADPAGDNPNPLHET
ncbi:MAG: hypothetical protein JXB62_01495 [Pirellulales bacterium]|nr:hypothetical protein [Pirellulales bacterium]